MVKNVYPDTTLHPIQVLDFVLKSGEIIQAQLQLQPDATRAVVADVHLYMTAAGGTTFSPITPKTTPQTILDAGTLAYDAATHQAAQAGSSIIEARLEGDEFLEAADVDQITGNAFPVTMY